MRSLLSLAQAGFLSVAAIYSGLQTSEVQPFGFDSSVLASLTVALHKPSVYLMCLQSPISCDATNYIRKNTYI